MCIRDRLTTSKRLGEIEELVEITKKEGAKVLLGAKIPSGFNKGYFYEQTIFDDISLTDSLDIEIFKADHSAYSKKLNKVVMLRDAPDHTKEDFVMLSGTRVRDMLAAGETLPAECARPEVAKILMSFYQQEGN